MANGDGLFGPTWRWIAAGMITVLLAAGSALLADTQNNIRTLWEKKVDKEQYRCDQARIEDKLDKLIDMTIKGRR